MIYHHWRQRRIEGWWDAILAALHVRERNGLAAGARGRVGSKRRLIAEGTPSRSEYRSTSARAEITTPCLGSGVP
jgi:hypothetical protein